MLSVHLLGAYAWHRTFPESGAAGAAGSAMVIELALPEPARGPEAADVAAEAAAPPGAPELAQPAEAPPPPGLGGAAAPPPDAAPPDVVHGEVAPPDAAVPSFLPPMAADAPPEAPAGLPPASPPPAFAVAADSGIPPLRPPPRPGRPARAGAEPGAPPPGKPAEREAAGQPASPPSPPSPAPGGAATASAGASAAPHIDPARWQGKVMAWLDRHKRYPAAARANREEGTAEVTFAIDPGGRVLGARISRSSGSPALDRAAVEMVTRASPVPAPPAGIARPSLSLTVPVDFRMR